MTGSAVAPATITCCSGSSVSSASETTKPLDASFSSSTIVGSVATSFSNASSGRSGRIFLPSGPITSGMASAAGAAFFAAALVAVLAAVLVVAALAGAAFLAAAFAGGASSLAAAAFLAGAFLAGAFLAGALAAAVLVLVALRVVVAATARTPTGMATLMP